MQSLEVFETQGFRARTQHQAWLPQHGPLESLAPHIQKKHALEHFSEARLGSRKAIRGGDEETGT